MHARLIKETRELLPIFGGTLLLIVVPYFIWGGDAEAFSYLVSGLGCVILGGWSFGNEYQHRTFGLLLSQPIPRSVLWRDKMLILGGSLVASLAVLWGCLEASGPGVGRGTQLGMTLAALCAFCGAPYWTLVLRNGIAGMALAAAVPTTILLMNALVAEQVFGAEQIGLNASAVVLLIIYCGGVYWLGYAKFKRLEALDASTHEVSLPPGLETAFTRPFAKVAARFRGPFVTLLKKEFRLQQVSFLLAGLFFLVAVAGFCLMRWHRSVAVVVVGGDFLIYVLILPLIAGAISVADERGWEIASWHLTLPPSALQQWSAKMLATLSTSLGLGLLLPTALFLAGAALLPHQGDTTLLPPVSQMVCWLLGSLLVTSVAVYAASFASNTLQAIPAAFVIFAAGCVVCVVLGTWSVKMIASQLSVLHRFQGPAFAHQLRVLIALLISCAQFLMLCVVQWLAWANFRRRRSSAGTIAVQLLGIFSALALLILAISVGFVIGLVLR